MKILRFALLFAALALVPLALRADGIINSIPTTPNLAVTASTTVSYTFDAVFGGMVDWVYIKNDCASPLWFDFRDARDSSARRYPLRLNQDQDFQAFVRLHTLYVSPANAGTACTFTLLGGERLK
jgi:hypothetical protein